MAIDYHCGSAARLSLADCRDLLAGELDLRISEERNTWLSNEGVVVMLRDYADRAPSATELELCGFTPRVAMMMRPRLQEQVLDVGNATMVRVVDCLLRHTGEDLCFAYEFERLLLVRRSGRVLVRTDAAHYSRFLRAPLITVPFEEAPLRP